MEWGIFIVYFIYVGVGFDGVLCLVVFVDYIEMDI